MDYKTLAIMITNKCDINCGMCCEEDVNIVDTVPLGLGKLVVSYEEKV